MKRSHGFNEGQIFPLLAFVSALWLWHMFGGRSEFDLLGTLGSSVQKLSLFAMFTVVALFAIGGWRYKFVEELKTNLVAFAIVVAAIIIGAALVLVN